LIFTFSGQVIQPGRHVINIRFIDHFQFLAIIITDNRMLLISEMLK